MNDSALQMWLEILGVIGVLGLVIHFVAIQYRAEDEEKERLKLKKICARIEEDRRNRNEPA